MRIAADDDRPRTRPGKASILASLSIAFFIPITAAAARHEPLGAALSSLQVLEDRYFADASSQTLREFAREYEAIYRRSLKPSIKTAHERGLGDDRLVELFDALLGHAFYSESVAAIDDALSLFPKIAKGNLDERARVERLYGACMLTRRFECARMLAEKYPEARLRPPPRIINSPRAGESGRVLDVSSDSTSLSVTTPEWKRGARIIMLFDPGCGPSQRALTFIQSNPSLKAHFETRATLIAPPISIARFHDFSAWSAKHPRLKGYIAYSIWDWPHFDHLRTPTFYFLSDGKLRWKFSGWIDPAEGEAALFKGMRSIGLNPEP